MDIKGHKPAWLISTVLVLAGVAGVLSGLLSQPAKEPSNTAGIPNSLSLAMVAASIGFTLGVWLVAHIALKGSKTSFKILAGLAIWFCAVLFLGKLDFWAARPLFAPNIIFGFAAAFFLILKLYTSSTLRMMLETVPVHRLINLQVFRVMGVGFLTLYTMKVLPGQFAIATGVGDIFIGITAPVVAYLYLQKKFFSRGLAMIWNYIGIADLVLAITLGNLTYSRPWQVIPTDIPNDPIALYPLVMIPLFAVPLSVLLHLFTLRALRQQSPEF